MSNSINPVGWFEIPATDLQRAKNFYSSVFGYKFQSLEMGPVKMEMFPWDENAKNTTGSLIQADSYVPSHEGTMVYFSVDDIEGTLEKVDENGGKILNPKMSIGEYGFVAHFEDSEGNRVALHSRQ